jgi:hypothetical protein
MRKYNVPFAAAPAVVVLLVLMSAVATAGTSSRDEKNHLARPAVHSMAQYHRHAARPETAHREFVRGFGYGAPAYTAAPPKVSLERWPGYVYIPGKGILGEACNLPTSACPNEMRDIQ